MGGSSDVASGAYSNTLTMAAKGQKLIYFVSQVRYAALGIAVAKRLANRYKSPVDLKGMKIGVSAPGSSEKKTSRGSTPGCACKMSQHSSYAARNAGSL